MWIVVDSEITHAGINPIKVPGTKAVDEPVEVAPADLHDKKATNKAAAPTKRPTYGSDWANVVRSIGAGEHWLPPKGPKSR